MVTGQCGIPSYDILLSHCVSVSISLSVCFSLSLVISLSVPLCVYFSRPLCLLSIGYPVSGPCDFVCISPYWVTQKLPQISTVILRICIGKVA